jgi:hypothetical protein
MIERTILDSMIYGMMMATTDLRITAFNQPVRPLRGGENL